MSAIFQNIRPVPVKCECDKIQRNKQYNGIASYIHDKDRP